MAREKTEKVGAETGQSQTSLLDGRELEVGSGIE